MDMITYNFRESSNTPEIYLETSNGPRVIAMTAFTIDEAFELLKELNQIYVEGTETESAWFNYEIKEQENGELAAEVSDPLGNIYCRSPNEDFAIYVCLSLNAALIAGTIEKQEEFQPPTPPAAAPTTLLTTFASIQIGKKFRRLGNEYFKISPTQCLKYQNGQLSEDFYYFDPTNGVIPVA